MTLPCLIPVRRLPTPSRSRHFGGLSEKKTLSDHVTRNAIVARSQQWGLWTRQGQTVVLYSLTLSLETLDTRILLLAVFTLALEMDYPSSTACVQSPLLYRHHSLIFFWGEGAAVNMLPVKRIIHLQTVHHNWQINRRIKSGGLFIQTQNHFVFTVKRYCLSDANYQTDNPSLVWKRPFHLL